MPGDCSKTCSGGQRAHPATVPGEHTTDPERRTTEYVKIPNTELMWTVCFMITSLERDLALRATQQIMNCGDYTGEPIFQQTMYACKRLLLWHLERWMEIREITFGMLSLNNAVEMFKGLQRWQCSCWWRCDEGSSRRAKWQWWAGGEEWEEIGRVRRFIVWFIQSDCEWDDGDLGF